MRIGRAPDNDLILGDGRVSRHHGRIAGRLGTLVYTDLGSTNGSRVNGEAVIEVVLGPGDRILVGDTTLEVRLGEPASLMDGGCCSCSGSSGSAFLLLLYLFLYRVVRTLLRDLRAAAREPTTTLGPARHRGVARR